MNIVHIKIHTSRGGGTFITKLNASAYLDGGIAVTGALAVDTKTAGIQRDAIIFCQTATMVNYKKSQGEQPLNVTISSNNTEKYIHLPKIGNQSYCLER